MNKKVFIDAGAHEGVILNHFMSRHKGYVAYAFEPNPNTQTLLPPNTTFIRKAVWVEGENHDFFLFSNDPASEGCTLIGTKTNKKLDRENPIQVECVDFNQWVLKNTSVDDKIILKMDIEGAEYDVLSHMIKGGSLDRIDKLYVEWHWEKVPTITRVMHKKLVQNVKKYTKLMGEYSRIYGL
jgi:FkbM family methyltransferase